MEIASFLSLFLALALLWASAAKLLSGSALASSPGMAWATREGLAGGTIAGVVELIAASLLILSALGVLGSELVPMLVGVGIAAHMGVASIKKSEADAAAGESAVGAGESGLPNLILGAIALMVAAVPLLT